MFTSRLIVSAARSLMGHVDARRLRRQPGPGDDIVQLLDIPYGADGCRGHLLDVYYSAAAQGKLPTIINIHGGGLFYGYKELNRCFNFELVRRGFAVISLNYRLLPQVTLHEQIKDVLNAFRFIVRDGGQWPCDLGQLFVVGDSAGGLLTLMAAAINNSDDLSATLAIERSGLQIRALGLISPMLHTMRRDGLAFISPMVVLPSERHKAVSRYLLNPVSALRETNLPPCWLVTSADDFLRKDGRRLKAELDQLQVSNCFTEWPLSTPKMLGHIFCVLYPGRRESVAAIDSMTSFFKAQLAP